MDIATSNPPRAIQWNKGKLLGQKPRPPDVGTQDSFDAAID